jgi:rifampicin phosphotransferase
VVPLGHKLRFGPIDMSAWETQQRNEPTGAVVHGFAVSPGQVSAPASVIRSPEDYLRMEPDTILVCPTTTPAWTPLFSQARGLVTDVGGVLAHGSIVAREYDIPPFWGPGWRPNGSDLGKGYASMGMRARSRCWTLRARQVPGGR